MGKLLRYSRQHNPIVQKYETMHERKRGQAGLPLLPTRATASILRQDQDRGPLREMHEQTQKNAMYLAVDDRPFDTRPHPADAMIGACCASLWLPVRLSALSGTSAAFKLGSEALRRMQGKGRH